MERTEAIERAKKLRSLATGTGPEADSARKKAVAFMLEHDLTAADLRDPGAPMADAEYRATGEQFAREATRRLADRPDQLGMLARLTRSLMEWE